MEKRKICFVITNLIHYSRSMLILERLRDHDDVELSIILGGAAVLPRYATGPAFLPKLLPSLGYENIRTLYFQTEGDGGLPSALSAGSASMQFAQAFHDLDPDVVVLRADRYEILAAAMSATHLQIPIAHIEGGDVSGTVDEHIRHAVTKLAHFHFVTNSDAHKRVLQLGEHGEHVHCVGAPDVEVVQALASRPNSDVHDRVKSSGAGHDVNIDESFGMVMLHPVTSEYDQAREQARLLVEKIHQTGKPFFWFWPNVDAGGGGIAKELRIFGNEVDSHRIRFINYLPPEDFIALLSRTECLIGNSSAGLKEAGFLGVPVVDIGTRQNNRLRGENVLHVDWAGGDLEKAIAAQWHAPRFDSSKTYNGEGVSERIVKILLEAPLYMQKQFVDLG